MKQSFSGIIKEEITKFDWSNEQLEYFLSTLIYISKNKDLIKFKQAMLGKVLYIYLKDKGIESKVSQVGSHYEMKIPSTFKAIGKETLLDLSLDQKFQSAIIGAMFVARGSANSPNSKYYHLDIRMTEDEGVDKLIDILNKYYLDAKKYKRDTRTTAYLKKSSNISDFLKLVNAHEGVMYFEDVRINRDFSNSIMRLSTIDFINSKKAVVASQKQIQKINELLKTDILRQYHERYTQIAELRLEHFDANLPELTNIYNEKYGTNYTKSAVNHWLRFLVKLEDRYVQ